MYWLLSSAEQAGLRERVTRLVGDLSVLTARDQSQQVFPFSGRKDRRIAGAIIARLLDQPGVVCDPFFGSGTFIYAALDNNMKVVGSEYEPYAFRLATAPFRLPSEAALDQSLNDLRQQVEATMNHFYRTTCAQCGSEHVLDSLFYDRVPRRYFKPTPHERLGPSGENVVFRGKYRCACGATEKHFDDSDQQHMDSLELISADSFPDNPLIENSRINFTFPEFSHYGALFPHRSKLVLNALYTAISAVGDQPSKDFLLDALLTILPQAKYTDYRSKSQDAHCPPVKNRENNLWHRFLAQVEKRREFLYRQFPDVRQANSLADLLGSCSRGVYLMERDFRDCLGVLPDGSCDLVLTDPPYGDSYQFFEAAQKYHPFMEFTLKNDTDRLQKEVVVSDSPERPDKRDRTQFIEDLEELLRESRRVLKEHGFLVLYFRPEQDHWLDDLNRLKLMGRKHGLEPLTTIDVTTNDPSMRVLASTAWTFASDIVFVFLRLREDERRWYEGDHDIDGYIYSAAAEASGRRGEAFVKTAFNEAFLRILRRENLRYLARPEYEQRIENVLRRFCSRDEARYTLTGESPYLTMTFGVDPELRVREFIPEVVEELTAGGQSFSFEDFIIRLSTYLDNGDRTVIERLHNIGSLVPNLLLEHAEEDPETGQFRARPEEPDVVPVGRIRIEDLSPGEFENLVGAFFEKRGFRDVQVVGRTNDRGVDITAVATDGGVHFIQCKRWRKGNNVGSPPIQRIDSMRRSRGATQAWLVTTSDFTREGLDEARITGVHAINGRTFRRALEVYFPGMYYLST